MHKLDKFCLPLTSFLRHRARLQNCFMLGQKDIILMCVSFLYNVGA